jgi:exopolysaccharide production protein ExoQ
MNPSVASLICVCVIAGLLYLDREKGVHVSRALWLPGIWIAVIGSRSLSSWFGISSTVYEKTEGTPFDAAVFGILLTVAIGVVLRRKSRARTLLLANWPIITYLLFGLISITWSYHPDITFKHWIKAIGDVAMVLVIATDTQPVAAIRRLISRIGMLLFPTSVLFIKYFDSLGRGYTDDGSLMNTGVTTNKNSLGLIVLVVSIVVLWNVRSLLMHKGEANRNRRLVAQGTLLAFCLALFWMADCSTAKACFALGSVLILLLNLRAIRRRPARVHALCLGILLTGGFVFLFAGQGDVANALGRKSNMSGRTAIWEAVLPAVPNSVIGAGFESFWISPNVQIFQRSLLASGWYPPLVEVLNEAHNGYIEVYLNLGWIGVSLIALILIGGYWRAYKAFQRDPELGSLFLAYIAIGVVYSITEAGFRFMSLSWIFLLLAVVSASGVTAGLFRVEKPKIFGSRSDRAEPDRGFQLIPERGTLQASPRLNSTYSQTVRELM